MDLNKLMQQAQKMQKDLGRIEEELNTTVYTGYAAGDLVTVKMTGAHEVTEVNITEEAMEDREMLQDLVLIAMNEAVARAAEDRSSKMNSVTQGIKLPGM